MSGVESSSGESGASERTSKTCRRSSGEKRNAGRMMSGVSARSEMKNGSWTKSGECGS